MTDREALRAALAHIEEAKAKIADGYPRPAIADAIIALAFATLYPYLPEEESADASE